MNAAVTAKEVISADISALALETVKRNAALNGFDNIKTVQADVFALLRDYKKAGEKFDLIVLDPPAFCKSAAEVKDAYRGYKDINIIAMKLVNEGGFLITCSCSHYMTLPLFEKCWRKRRKRAGKRRNASKSERRRPITRHF